jgi:hypothetical protein
MESAIGPRNGIVAPGRHRARQTAACASVPIELRLASLLSEAEHAAVPQRVTMYLDAGQPFGNVAGRLS